MRIVLDTNVVVSALLTGGGTADMAVQLVLQGAATLLVDSRILAEYDEVSSRPRFALPATERRIVLEILQALAEPVVAAPLQVTLPDPDDRLFVEVALAGRADAIVTGNPRHFVPLQGTLPAAVLTPRVFVERMRRG
jgi:putative PIN family toxin of toxin-antitoxin system